MLSTHNRSKLTDIALNSFKKHEDFLTAKDKFIIGQFLNSYVGLQKFKHSMGFSIFRYFINKLRYQSFDEGEVLWRNDDELSKSETLQAIFQRRISKNGQKMFKVLLKGRLTVIHQLEDEKGTLDKKIVDKFQMEFTEENLKKFGLTKPLEVKAFTECHCLTLMQEDYDTFFAKSSLEQFKLSLSKLYNFLRMIDLFDDLREKELIQVALYSSCCQYKIRSYIHKASKESNYNL
jgi:hypothetical protein